MKSEDLPKIETEQYDPNLDAQDEDVISGGNNRLTYILVGVIIALVIGYIALPKGSGSGLSSVTPTFMLDDAAVVATVPAADASAPEETATEEEAKEAGQPASAKTTKKNTVVVNSSQAASGATAGETETAATVSATAPESAPAATPVAAVEAAPANVTVTGKIEDENGHPLVGATVLLKGSSKGTSTDANGNYSLEVPAGTDNTFIYGYGGYDDEVAHSRGSQPVNVILTPRAKASKRRR